MLLRKKKNKAQSTLEYAVIIACVAGALIAMGVYVKRGLSGRFRQSADELGSQYSPTDTEGGSLIRIRSRSNTTSTPKTEKDLGVGDKREDVYFTETKSSLDYENTTQGGYEKVGPLEKKLF